ncbi:tryptophan-rich sensory protein TspO [Paracoccus aestuariivivens]|uniref:Sensory protein TspO n=1 Tax=Paracoccus aestuariivivens TaxID=1820333 RepID=A0A6L6J7Q6_9RHOB|nr:TspO/MBR family protein [Paracoccus aestuariivivens]MTH76759.1 sensory protein TspO [Paracoccus aestuariivivens]
MLFLTFLIACGAAAATGYFFQPGTWYDELQKPDVTPPRWVFPVAWSVLYVLIAWAASRLAVIPGSGTVMALWSAQIALNTLWTPVFFGAHRTDIALGIIILLWLIVALMTFLSVWLDAWAAMMFLPYLAWLTIAAGLNHAIWQDNR